MTTKTPTIMLMVMMTAMMIMITVTPTVVDDTTTGITTMIKMTTRKTKTLSIKERPYDEVLGVKL